MGKPPRNQGSPAQDNGANEPSSAPAHAPSPDRRPLIPEYAQGIKDFVRNSFKHFHRPVDSPQAPAPVPAAPDDLIERLCASPDFFIGIDTDYRIRFLTDGTAAADSPDILGTSVFHWAVPECHEQMRAALDHTLRTGRGTTYFSTGIHPDGSRHDYASRVILFQCENREPMLLIAANDITRNQSAREWYNTDRQRYRMICEYASELIAHFDPQGIFRFASGASRTILGREPADLIGLSMFDFIHPDDIPRCRECHRAILDKSLDSCPLQFRVRHSSGDYVWVESQPRAILDTRCESVIEIIAICRDISDRKSGEDLLRRQEQALFHVGRVITIGEMASGLAHELNQPLCAISTYADACARLLNAPHIDKTLILETIHKISAQAARAGVVINHIKGLIRGREPDKKICAFQDILNPSFELLEYELRTAGVITDFDIEPGLPGFLADPVQIQQVLLNLVRNSIDALRLVPRGERRIRLTARRQNPATLKIDIADNGRGLSKEECRKVFESFYTTRKDGLGIGLRICESIIESHGGTIRACPNPPRGAVFSFTIPLLQEL